VTRAIGIDLGTTNSAAAVIDPDGRPRIFTTAAGSTTMPSLVWFADEGPMVGDEARSGLEEQPEQTISGVKRLLGRPFEHPDVRRLAKVLPYELTPAQNGDVWISLQGGNRVSPEQVSGLILRQVRANAERVLGEEVTEAVITVPAWFDSTQRQATKDAAAIAGLTVRRLLSEPTAAALGHGAHRGENVRYVVCDFGGGTFDVAVVDVAGGVFEVLATTGDPFLGGDDIDRAIVEQLVRDVRTARGLDVTTDAAAIDRLRLAAQRAKHELSAVSSADLRIPQLGMLPSGKAIEYARTLRRDEVELWGAPLLRRLEGPCREALKKAGRLPQQVDEVLLVGGMTRMPAVRRQIAKIFGREPKVIPNPDEVVAIGAAIEVARIEGQISGILLLDVCARGLAVSVGGGNCDVVIAPSSVVPTREHRLLPTTTQGQRRMEFDLWEGESHDPGQNRHLGRYAVSDLPDAPPAEVLVLIELTLDVDGTVRLAASELVSGERPPVETVISVGLPRAEVTRLRDQTQAHAWDR
jgi:molecular chaperone DnaK